MDRAGCLFIADDEFVFRGAPGKFSCVNDECAGIAEGAFVAQEGLIDEFIRGKLVMDIVCVEQSFTDHFFLREDNRWNGHIRLSFVGGIKLGIFNFPGWTLKGSEI